MFSLAAKDWRPDRIYRNRGEIWKELMVNMDKYDLIIAAQAAKEQMICRNKKAPDWRAEHDNH